MDSKVKMTSGNSGSISRKVKTMGLFTQKLLVKGIATCADGSKYSIKSPVVARFVTLSEVEEAIRKRLQFEL